MNRPPQSRRAMARAAGGVALRLLLLYGFVQLVVSAALLLNLGRNEVPLPEELRAVAFEHGGFDRVEFFATDGLTLRGELLGNTQRGPVVILAHGYRLRRRAGDALAKDLIARDFGVLLFDFRGCGASDGAFTTAGGLEERDVSGAIRHLESLGIAKRRIGFVGFSMGAVAGLLAAERLEGIAAAVFVAPYAEMIETFEARTLHYAGLPLRPTFTPALAFYRMATGIDPELVRPVEHGATLVKTPCLLLGGDRDWRAPPSDLERIRAAAGNRPELVILPGLDHLALSRFQPTTRQPIVDFLVKHLPKKSR